MLIQEERNYLQTKNHKLREFMPNKRRMKKFLMYNVDYEKKYDLVY